MIDSATQTTMNATTVFVDIGCYSSVAPVRWANSRRARIQNCSSRSAITPAAPLTTVLRSAGAWVRMWSA
jgi:hypothetical protein